ncbi:Zinc finger protein 397 [Frankliniella fusca]|uniref:Zinc finger protein 397 n=1 Tax=Frankliniella fusca TaxID=407009 RepID=A0AAE1HE11_9NEOP|nr:Zinc finger protein 397 [Frankliniella fusca]
MGSVGSNSHRTEEERAPETTLPPPLTPLQLYEPLENEDIRDIPLESTLSLSLFDDMDKNASSFRKEMDVLLCGETDSQQTVSRLSCCSEPRSLTSPSFSLQDFSMDQGNHLPMNEFPLSEEQLPPVKTVNETESEGSKMEYTAATKSVDTKSSDQSIMSEGQQVSSSVEEESHITHPFGQQLQKSISYQEFEASPSLDNRAIHQTIGTLPSFLGSINADVGSFKMQNELNTVLTVDAKVVGASGEIKFQRNMGGVKIVFPPTTAEKAIKFDDLISLFSLNEVRQAFCAESKEEEIIHQLVQQGLGSEGVTQSGRLSSLSQASSLDLPNSLLSPLSSVCDSWSWEISQLLSGDDNSNEGDNRSELNTPIVTLPPRLTDNSNLEKPIHSVPPPYNVLLDVPTSSPLDNLSVSSNFKISNSKVSPMPEKNPSNIPCNLSIPQGLFTPLQVQIPEDSDNPSRISRTLHSSNTYFDEISLGISPVIDLDPNVATVRMSCPPSENFHQSPSRKCTETMSFLVPNVSNTATELANINASTAVVSNDDDCDIKEVAVDIIIDDGKMNWLKLLPDPTDEFVKKISHKCYKCHICSRSFRFKFQVQRHIKITHSTSKPFICAVCGATFSIKHYLTRHMKVHGDNKLQCSSCDKKFTRQYQLAEHELTHTDPSCMKCPDCGKQCNSKNAFNVHKSICSGTLQPYICDICGKTYPGLTALNHHRARHDSVKSFKCTMCESSFHTQWQLVKHTKRHATQGLYVCNFCSLAFNSTTNLKKHKAKCPALTVNKIGFDFLVAVFFCHSRNEDERFLSSPVSVDVEADDVDPDQLEGTSRLDNTKFPTASPKKKFVYLVKNAGHMPVESVLSAVLGNQEPNSSRGLSLLAPKSKSSSGKRQKRKRSPDDKLSQRVLIKGSDGKENMIFLDVPEPLNVVSTELQASSEDVDDPTWAPTNSGNTSAKSTSWSKLKRARSAVRNSMKILRLPKPRNKRESRAERSLRTPVRKQAPISKDDPNYAIMMEKFAKPVSISTLKRHGLYQPKPNGYKINAPYKKDVAPYIEKVSDTEFKCKICLTAKFRWNYKAEIHILEHLDWRPFECDVCGRAFTQNQYLTKHKRLHFPDDTNFICEVCGKGFQRRYYLTYHMDEHFDRTYTCEECGRKFSRRQKHDEHVRYHHKCHYSICDICGQTLRTTALSRHRKQHTEKSQGRKKRETNTNAGTSQSAWLPCSICGRAFRSPKERDDHEAEHNNSLLPFQCEPCILFFKTKRTLNNHIINSHSQVGEQECEVASQEEECDIAIQEEDCDDPSEVLDELSSTIIVSIPGEL